MINTTTASFKRGPNSVSIKIPISKPKRLRIDTLKSTSLIIHLFLSEGLEAHYDMIVVGGGAIGCSVAFWLMQRVIEGFKILVVGRDPQVCIYLCDL